MVARGSDATTDLQARLRELFTLARRPTYRGLEAHADQAGRTLRTSTVSDLLNGSSTPRWETVATFVDACARHARAHRIALDPQAVDLDRWYGLYQAMENDLADRAAERERIAGRPVAVRSGRFAVPAQLPAANPIFAGAIDRIAELDKLAAGGDGPGAVTVVVIDGTAGVGKTTLAVHWAHRVAAGFPDGQLYVNLRGFHPEEPTVSPAHVVHGFLDALGVPVPRIPAGLDARAAMYRSLLAGRRVLVVLDNAHDSAQVRPLLPGTTGCLVVVTSRSRLTGLVADGARPVSLELPSAAEAREMLARQVGADRVAAEPDAVTTIIERCARLPLALGLAGANAAIHRRTPLATLAGQLSGAPWDTLTGDSPGTDLRTVLSWSYHALGPAAAGLFRLLGVAPGPEVTVPVAASLAGIEAGQARRSLGELLRNNLIIELRPGRYTLHDLLRAYAAELAAGDPQRRAAIGRVLSHYLHTADAAVRRIMPLDPGTMTTLRPGVVPEAPGDEHAALAWLSTEHEALLAAVELAGREGFDAEVGELAWTLWDFLDLNGHWPDMAAVQGLALRAARRMGDRAGQRRAHGGLARAATLLGHREEAEEHYRRALELAVELGDRAGQAHIHRGLARLHEGQRDLGRALGHARQALDLLTAPDDEVRRAAAQNHVGWLHALLGDYEQAVACCSEALAVHERADFRHGMAAALDSLGYCHFHQGDHRRARERYREALRLYERLGERYNQADVLTHLGDAYRAAGDEQAAGLAWRRALTILDDLRHTDADAVRARLTA